MKTNKILTLSIAFLLTTFAIITSCKSFDEITEDFDIIINNSVFKQQILVEVFDPVDQSNLNGSNVLKVEVMGEDADKIVTDAGNSTSTLKVVNGAIALAVNPNKNTNNEPVQFMLKISGDNYLTTTIPVFLSENDSIATFSANVVNKLNTSKGVDYIKSDETLVNNTLSQDVSVETSGTKAGTTSKVTIKSGTIFKDINGNNISGNKIESEVVHFNSNDPESLSSFPGGFMPQEITDENGDKVDDAYFETAGFVSIDMKIGDKEVKNFSEPITIKMQVAPDYVNPETGNVIKVGDIIPIWSYSKDDGKWDYHTDGTVTKDSNNNFVVEYTTTHLSWYNLDFKGRRCSSWVRSGGRWTYSPLAKINVSMNGITRANAFRLFSTFVYEGTNQSVSRFAGKTKSWYDGQTFQLNNAPSGRNIQMVIYSGQSRYRKGEILYKSPAFNPCSGTVNLNVSSIISKLPQLVNVKVNYTGICNGKKIEPSVYLYMKDPTYGYWRYIGYVYKGSVTIRQIELNKEYEFGTYYNGQFYSQSLSFDKTEYINDNYQIPSDLCNRLF
ncbi:hypothetical protein [Polaribacter sp. Z022]|uniref:hypothetical protein n=1 Tax=Polaribacter sp. Z022 TaxID=2927125 RepID=UPI00202105A3|nr:hypothetical protein [Polaribacter sp. Z022]MCL7752893.1 hypothetical protein [Polaribacter sp. Z022]